jgi:uncharacterized protein (TIGR02001 family)
MLTSIRSLLAATVLAGAAFVSTPVLAQDADEDSSDISVSGNVALTTDYRFRGVSLSGGDPAIQGGINVGLPAGFYVGAWSSSIDGGAYGSQELDLFGGWSGEVASGLTFDVGLLKYIYPNGASGVDLDYWEPYTSLAFSAGPATVKVGAAYAWDQDSLGGDDNLYLYTNVDFGLPTTPLTVSAHVGYTKGVLAPAVLTTLSTDDSGFDYSIGASATVLGALTLGVSYIGVDGPSVDGFTDDTIVATLTASF